MSNRSASGLGRERGPGRQDHRRRTAHTRYRTADREEAEQVITDLYLPNRLDLLGGEAPLGMEVSGVRLGALTAGRLTYGSRVRLRTADAKNYHVNLPLHGRATSRRGAGEAVTTGPGEGLVFSPGAPAEISWSADCEQLCLMVPGGRLEQAFEQLLGRSPRSRLTFDFAADLQSLLGRRWRTVLDLLVDELDRPTEVSQNSRAGRHLEALVLDGLLLSQAHSGRHGVIGTGPAAPRSAIRRAVDLIEDDPAEPWTTVGLAAEVHLSPRALQAGFRRDLETTPMRYLRRVRLHRAREALEAAGPDTTTVRAVAVGLGILHPSRFAAAYRDTFGESPSDTLARHP